MTIDYFGPYIEIHYDANEVSSPYQTIQLADGYSYERILINNAVNVYKVGPYKNISNGIRITCPVVNSKSPSMLSVRILDQTKETDLRLSIEKFGQIPDSHYFDKAFDPILVTGDDGKEYKVIPSDQFK